MTADRDRGLGVVLGLLGAALLALEAILDIVRGLVDVAQRGALRLPPFLGQAVIFLVLAILVGVFALLVRPARQERTVVSGAVLVVLALAGWLVLGTGGTLLSLVATVLVLVSGVIFLVAGR